MSKSPPWLTENPPKDRRIILIGNLVNGDFREPLCELVEWDEKGRDWKRVSNGCTLKQCGDDEVQINFWAVAPDNLVDVKPNACI